MSIKIYHRRYIRNDTHKTHKRIQSQPWSTVGSAPGGAPQQEKQKEEVQYAAYEQFCKSGDPHRRHRQRLAEMVVGSKVFNVNGLVVKVSAVIRMVDGWAGLSFQFG